MNLDLNARQRAVYDLLVAAAVSGSRAPTNRQIADALGWAVVTADSVVSRLLRRGVFRSTQVDRARVVEIVPLGISTAEPGREADAAAMTKKRARAIEYRRAGWRCTEISDSLRVVAPLVRVWVGEAGMDPDATVPGRYPRVDNRPTEYLPWPKITMRVSDWPVFAKFRDDPRAPKTGEPDNGRPPPRNRVDAVSYCSSSAAWATR